MLTAASVCVIIAIVAAVLAFLSVEAREGNSGVFGAASLVFVAAGFILLLVNSLVNI